MSSCDSVNLQNLELKQAKLVQKGRFLQFTPSTCARLDKCSWATDHNLPVPVRGKGGRVTRDDVRVDVEGVVGRVDAPLLEVLLAQGEGAAVHAEPRHVRVAPHRGLRQRQVLRGRERQRLYPKRCTFI